MFGKGKKGEIIETADAGKIIKAKIDAYRVTAEPRSKGGLFARDEGVSALLKRKRALSPC